MLEINSKISLLYSSKTGNNTLDKINSKSLRNNKLFTKRNLFSIIRSDSKISKELPKLLIKRLKDL